MEELKKYLSIDKKALDDEVSNQATLFFNVAEAAISATAKRDAWKEELSQAEAKLDLQFREEFEEAKTKYTESQIKSLITADPDRCKINEAYLKAKAECEGLNALKEAFHQRGYMLRDLCQLYIANYFEDSSVRIGQHEDNAVYKRRRAMLAEGRKIRGDGVGSS